MSGPTVTAPGRIATTAHGWAWLVVTLVGSCLVSWLALSDVDGVTQVGATSFETEFVNGDRWSLCFLLVVPVFLAARSWWPLGIGAVVVAVVPQLAVARETVARYVASGWSDGLEVLAYAQPLALALCCAIAAGLGAWRGRRLATW